MRFGIRAATALRPGAVEEIDEKRMTRVDQWVMTRGCGKTRRYEDVVGCGYPLIPVDTG